MPSHTPSSRPITEFWGASVPLARPRGLSANRLIALGLVLASFHAPFVRAAQAQAGPRAQTRPKEGAPSALRLGALTLDPEVRIEVDWTGAGTSETGGLSLDGKRVGLEGQLGRSLNFEVSGELTSSAPWRTIRVSYTAGPATISAGQFKVPYGLDAARSAADRDFVDRSRLANAFSMGRDVGISLSSSLWRKRVEIETAYFLHDGSRSMSDDPVSGHARQSWVTRAEAAPFLRARHALRHARVGLSVASSRLPEALSPLTLQTLAGRELSTPSFWAAGRRRRTGVDLSWRHGPAALVAEFATAADERRRQGVGNDDLRPVTGAGWYVAGSWFVTGEVKAKRVRPRHPLITGGTGAVEIVGRLERAWIGHTGPGEEASINPRSPHVPMSQLRVVTTGVNWHVATGARLQFNFSREHVQGATPSLLSVGPLSSAVFRLQVFL